MGKPRMIVSSNIHWWSNYKEMQGNDSYKSGYWLLLSEGRGLRLGWYILWGASVGAGKVPFLELDDGYKSGWLIIVLNICLVLFSNSIS